MINNYKYILVTLLSIFFIFGINYNNLENFKDDCDCKNMKNDIRINSIELEINKLKMNQKELKKNQEIIQKKIKSFEDAGKASEKDEKLI